MAKQMNRWGPEEARNNASKILEVMRTEAARRGLPFTDFIAMRILNRAIANAEAEAKRMLDLR